MIPVEEVENMFDINQTAVKTPNISFDSPHDALTNELYTPTEFAPLQEEFSNPPSNAPSPSSLGSPPPRIITGKASRFISAKNESTSEDSLEMESPEKREKKVCTFFNEKKITRPDEYEPGNTDWQYNKFLRTYEFRPGMDYYTTKKCRFEIEIIQNEASHFLDSDSE